MIAGLPARVTELINSITVALREDRLEDIPAAIEELEIVSPPDALYVKQVLEPLMP